MQKNTSISTKKNPVFRFDDLAGSLKSRVSLTDEELRLARDSFGRQWPRKPAKTRV